MLKCVLRKQLRRTSGRRCEEREGDDGGEPSDSEGWRLITQRGERSSRVSGGQEERL